MYQPKIYPATLEQLAVIARKECMSVERLMNLYLIAAVTHEQLMERETAVEILESVFVRCIESRALEPGKRSRSVVPVNSMIYRIMGSNILAILAKIVIATYCFKRGYTT
jgi:hypothetical protein